MCRAGVNKIKLHRSRSFEDVLLSNECIYLFKLGKPEVFLYFTRGRFHEGTARLTCAAARRLVTVFRTVALAAALL